MNKTIRSTKSLLQFCLKRKILSKTMTLFNSTLTALIINNKTTKTKHVGIMSKIPNENQF